MGKELTFKQRKELREKASKVFSQNMKGLSPELQRMLSDDLVVAFESRINVLIRAQGRSG